MYSMKDEDRFCMDRWKGQNLLGKILMRVREETRHQRKVLQAFQNAENGFSGAAEEAGFHEEGELQDYVKEIRRQKE